MPIRVTLSRKGRASKRRKLQQDEAVWKLCKDLNPLLAVAGAQRLEARAIRAHLACLYEDVELRELPPEYELVWSPILLQWEIICHEEATITVESGDVELEVRLDACASYA